MIRSFKFSLDMLRQHFTLTCYTDNLSLIIFVCFYVNIYIHTCISKHIRFVSIYTYKHIISIYIERETT
jgi:hypothetical protein